jgi:hypothetical protein
MGQMVILGLSVNARMLGLAVISGNVLVDYHIQLRKDAWTPYKKELILASLQPWCSSYSIKSIALSITYENQTSSQTKELLESLTRYFSEKNLPIFSYHVKTLYAFCTEAKSKTKKELMRSLALRYPELDRYYKKEVRNKNKYYIKIFEAVGVATLHSQMVQEKNKH